MRCTCNRTSRYLNFPTYLSLTQNLDKSHNLDKQINSFHIQITLTMEAKNFSQKISPQKFLPKEFVPKNSSKTNPQKKFLKKFLKKYSQKIPKKSKLFLKKLPRFWKYPIPYIALRGLKPFWACLAFGLQPWHLKKFGL